jgi:hypothetical protein|tara:strand:- start:169 stop:333 length:165 start_codon:yes stop_codon:yes gene_type:complete
VNLVSSFSATVSPSEKYRVVKLTEGIASLIPGYNPKSLRDKSCLRHLIGSTDPF